MSFRRLVTGVALALPLLIPTAARADIKVAWVDRERALTEIDEARAATNRLKAAVTSKQKELEKEQDALLKEADQLKKQAATMNDEAKMAKQTEFQGKLLAFEQKKQRSQMEVAESQQKELQPILNRMQQVIEQIAKREGLTLVVDRAAVAYAPPSLELTNEVVRLYNDQFKVKAPAKGSDAPRAPAPDKKPADAPKK